MTSEEAANWLWKRATVGSERVFTVRVMCDTIRDDEGVRVQYWAYVWGAKNLASSRSDNPETAARSCLRKWLRGGA